MINFKQAKIQTYFVNWNFVNVIQTVCMQKYDKQRLA